MDLPEFRGSAAHAKYHKPCFFGIYNANFWFMVPCFKRHLSNKFDRPEMIRDRAKMNLAGHHVRRLRKFFPALIHSAGHYLNWTGNNKDYMVFKIVSVFRTAVHFFSTCQALKRGSSYQW